MDGDFQQQYQAAEQAYGEGRYPDAQGLATTLLEQLEATPDTPETRAAKLGWRAIVGLLLGHIALYGQNRSDQAKRFYRLVLDSDPQETLAELAHQGLERCQLQLPVEKQPVEKKLPDLLQDPFITPSTTAEAQTAQQPTRPTAMPWLDAASPDPSSPSDQQSLDPLPTEPDQKTEPEPTPLTQPVPVPPPTPTPAQDVEPVKDHDAIAAERLSGALLRIRLDGIEPLDQKQRADDDASASLFQRLQRRLKRSDRG